MQQTSPVVTVVLKTFIETVFSDIRHCILMLYATRPLNVLSPSTKRRVTLLREAEATTVTSAYKSAIRIGAP